MFGGTTLASVVGAFRQWRHPREFRIKKNAWPPEALAILEQQAPAVRDEEQDGDPPAEATGLADDAVADLATSLWRLKTRMERSPDMPRVMTRHLEAAWDVLAEAGVEVRDHLHEPFDPGVSFKVIAFQPCPDASRRQVVETVRPGVYRGSRTLRMAEVIIGTPEREPDGEEKAGEGEK